MKLSTAVIAATAISLPAVLVTGAAASASTTATGRAAHWDASWASAPQPPVASSSTFGPNWSTGGFSDQTVRQTIRLSSGGGQVRIRLSNQYGRQPLHLTGATVAEARPGGAGIRPGTEHTLRFHRARSVTIPAGQAAASDAAALPVTALESLTVTLYFAGPTGPSTFHEDGLTTTYAASGDQLADTTGAAFTGTTSHSSYYLDGVDVSGGANRGTVVAFGDSISNGHNSTVGASARYSDVLAERLAAAHRPLGVANAGITGNLLLNQVPCFGEAGVARFQRDALGQPGVRTVILLEGTNDIWDSRNIPACGVTPAVTAQQLIRGYRTLIRAAHARGIRVVGATMLPFKASYEQPADFAQAEAVRQAVNHWILTSGQYDVVVDFAAVVADPADPQQLNPAYDSGDHLHPNDAGYRALADAINLAGL
jgi:lysophospholipase L1-like esterase